MIKNIFRLFYRFSTAVVCLLIAVTFVSAQYKGAKPVPAKWRKGFQTIKIEDAKNILNFLAGPDFLGRSPTQVGYGAAVGFAASYFHNIGLKPAGTETSYLQRFSMTEVRIMPETASVVSADGTIKFEYGKDINFRAPEDFEARAQFVFVRLPRGSDMSGLDMNILKGKVVILSPDTIANNREGLTRIAVSDVGAIIGSAVRTEQPLGEGAPFQRNRDIPILPTDNKFSVVRIKDSSASKLAESCGAKNYLTPNATQATFEVCDKEFIFKAKVSSRSLFETANVLGKIEGTDPELKNEAVFIGAHLDHLGARNNGVYWGADDDGSGVTAVMLMARAIMQNPVKPKRTVIFALWSGEELGVLGSRNYVNRPTFPLDKIISYLNLDMVGRNEEDKRFNEKPENNTTSVYTGSVKFNSEDLYKLLHDTNVYVNLRLKDDHEDRVLRTDTANFYNRNIPTLKTFTGEHLDYHQMTDTPDKINYEKLTNVAKWIYLTIMELSTNPVKPRYERKPFVAAPNPTD